ncbi:uncharacterized protein LOC141649543 [Silene latifolia]|uniref:uncharacterized protein LOC141649543 n=1 Tax=Silene latifolia TaxID=37657 RepID=UPI003D77B8CC
MLVDDNGLERSGHDEVSGVVTDYFKQLFTLSNPGNFDDTLVGLEGRVTDRMNAGLRLEYREEEVIEALNQMHPLKAPGPDGMNALFFQSFWHIIGPEVIKTVLGILRGELDPGEFNNTNIVLTPKKKAPDKIRDFRPISQCNVVYRLGKMVYKLVAKVLANRLKLFLSEIISENQSAFTPGRLITDNVLIAFEMFHHMKNSRQNDGFMAVKLDMAKAYDRVEWRFLRRVLDVMNFYRGWVSRVMSCVPSVSFSVLINGVQTSEFHPERDDSIFFVKATEDEAEIVSGILRRYEAASGELVSLEKTTVSFSKWVPRVMRDRVLDKLRVREVETQERYLGLPTVVGRSKKVLTDILRDKLSKRLQGWRGKLLSKAGREVLIKAVANSLPTYVMSVFKIPATFCNVLRSMVSRFWWGHGEGKRGKQAWRLVADPECLWARVMKAKYYHTRDFMNAEVGQRPSYTWRSIIGAREVLERGLRRRIGDGRDTRVWGQPWVEGCQRGKVISPCGPGNELMYVADLLKPGGRGWDEEMLNRYFLPFEAKRILNMRVSPNMPRDVWYWGLEKDGEYSVKSAYACLVGDASNSGSSSNWEKEKWLWNRLWKVEPDRVVQRVRDILQEESGNVGYGEGRGRKRAKDTSGEEHEGWRPAAEGYIKINVDAGIKEEEGVSTGAVCRDVRGRVLWGLTVERDVVWDPRFAEAAAVLDGLQEARARGFQRVMLESDCLQVIDALREKRNGRSSFSLLIADILHLCNSFSSVIWSHTSRINNMVAHALAHVFPRVAGKTIWSNVLPPVADSAAAFDLSLMN